MKKKLLCCVLVLLMITTLIPQMAFQASAKTSGDWEYDILSNDTAAITAYNGSATKLTIPSKLNGYTVTTIDQNTFKGCTALTSVTIPSSITSIQQWAFTDCTKLASIKIPGSVTQIGRYVFDNTAIYNNASDNSVVYADKWAVAYKGNINKLSSVTLKQGTVGIASGVFGECTELTTVTMPQELKFVGRETFEHCSKLTDINLPENLEKIEYRAFRGCAKLTSVKIPSSMTEIENDVFLGCIGLTSVTIPTSIKSIGAGAFWECSSLESITIPSSVKTIGAGAFWGCSSLKSITIPSGIKTIEAETFENCTKLESVKIPSSVTSIGREAFENTKIYNDAWDDAIYNNIGVNDVVYIGKWAIGFTGRRNGGESIKVTVKEGTVGLINELFGFFMDEGGYETVKSVKLPDSLKYIGENTFSGCTNLTSIKIPDGVTSIGMDSFNGCTGLTSVTIPDSVTTIGVYAFAGCTGLKSIKIPSSVKTIRSGAFENCTSLTSIKIPSGVTEISRYTFSGCTGLKSVTMSKGITKIDMAAFSDCTSLKSITIPSTVETIEYAAFIRCTNLTSVTMFKGTTTIGRYAFLGCNSMKTMAVPSSAEIIRDDSIGYNDKNEKISNFIIYGIKGTGAEAYAKAKGFTFKGVASTKLSKTSITMGVGETYTLKTTKGNAPFKYSTGDSSVATVSSSGKITAKKSGTVTITVTSNSGKKATCKVTVKKAPTKVSLNKTSITLGIGETFDLNSTVNSGAASYKTTYSSGKSSVASVKSAGGLVTAKKVGTTTIKVKTFNGKTATCKVTVKKAPTKVSLNKKSITLKVGQTFDLNSTVNSGAASYYTTYSSNKSSVASVKSAGGLVTAKKAGTATITVKTFNGKKATCKVTVKK